MFFLPELEVLFVATQVARSKAAEATRRVQDAAEKRQNEINARREVQPARPRPRPRPRPRLRPYRIRSLLLPIIGPFDFIALILISGPLFHPSLSRLLFWRHVDENLTACSKCPRSRWSL